MSGIATAIAVGTTLQATSQIAQGEAAQAAGNANAKSLGVQAKRAKAKAAEDNRKFMMNFRRSEGANRAAIGAAGITTEGSAMEVLQENARNAEIESLQIINQGEASAFFLMLDGQISRMEGDSAQRAGNLMAAGTAIGGGGRAALAFRDRPQSGGKP